MDPVAAELEELEEEEDSFLDVFFIFFFFFFDLPISGLHMHRAAIGPALGQTGPNSHKQLHLLQSGL